MDVTGAAWGWVGGGGGGGWGLRVHLMNSLKPGDACRTLAVYSSLYFDNCSIPTEWKQLQVFRVMKPISSVL